MCWRDLIALGLGFTLAAGCGASRDPAAAPAAVADGSQSTVAEVATPPEHDRESPDTVSSARSKDTVAAVMPSAERAAQQSSDTGTSDAASQPPAAEMADVSAKPGGDEPSPAQAAAPANDERPARSAENHTTPERLILFTPAGPLVCAVTVTISGHDSGEQLDKLVADATDAIAPADGRRLKWVALVASRQFRTGQFGIPPITEAEQKNTIARYDWNRNGRVEPDEMRRLLTQNQSRGEILSLRASDSSTGNNVTAAPTWRLLDADSDGSISAAEIASAAQRLLRRDSDEDDALVLSELSESMSSSGSASAALRSAVPVAQLVGADSDWEGLRRTLRSIYPRRGMTPEEWLIKLPLMHALDSDASGGLTRDEVKQTATSAPDLTIAAHFVRKDDNGNPAIVVTPGASADLWNAPPQSRDGSTVYATMPGLVLALSLDSPDEMAGDPAETATARFSELDRDSNGYLESAELMPAAEQLAPFEALDINGDEKVYPDELALYLQRRQAASSSRAGVTVERVADALFAALDTDGNGRLGAREISAVPVRLAALDTNGDGRVEPREIDDHITILITRGQPSGAMMAGSSYIAAMRGRGGPTWFQRMDTNRDGDLSPREFLGTRARFEELDANGDDFIDSGEAEMPANTAK